VKLLVDEQLPPALARWLREQGADAEHVSDLGLQRGSDQVIWKKAVGLNAAVLTKDEDFVLLRVSATSQVPIVWIRVGNCTNRALLKWFAPLWPDIKRHLDQGDSFIEIRP
jgi:predicted nuclease of predicted toxin-antitoxin system